MSNKVTKAAFSLITGASLLLSVNAFAQSAPIDPGHPRVNQVEKRIDNQEARVNRGVSDGQINASQAARDDAKIGREQTSLNRDMAAHHGHITRANQRHLNHRLNHGSRTIHRQSTAH